MELYPISLTIGKSSSEKMCDFPNTYLLIVFQNTLGSNGLSEFVTKNDRVRSGLDIKYEHFFYPKLCLHEGPPLIGPCIGNLPFYHDLKFCKKGSYAVITRISMQKCTMRRASRGGLEKKSAHRSVSK